MRHRLATLAVLLFALSACGGSEDVGFGDDDDSVAEVVTVFSAALSAGDGARACSLMSPAAQDALAKDTETTGCLTAVEALSKDLTSADSAAWKSVDVSEVERTGATATATADAPELTGISRGGAFTLIRSEEHWLIDA